MGGPPVRNLAQYRKWAAQKVGPMADRLLASVSRLPPMRSACRGGAGFGRSGLPVWHALRAARRGQGQSETLSISVHARQRRRPADPLGQLSRVRNPLYFARLCPIRSTARRPSFFGDFSVNPDTYNEQDRKLSQAMSGAWVAFAKTGSPNGPGLAHWPAFARQEKAIWSLATRSPPRNRCEKRRSIS